MFLLEPGQVPRVIEGNLGKRGPSHNHHAARIAIFFRASHAARVVLDAAAPADHVQASSLSFTSHASISQPGKGNRRAFVTWSNRTVEADGPHMVHECEVAPD
jgi:hypothetical protein